MYNYEITLHKEKILNPKKLGCGALCFVLEGQSLLTINNKDYTYSVGDLFYLQDNDNFLPIINDGLVAILQISYSMMESLSGESSFLYSIVKTTTSDPLDKYKQEIKDLFIRAILADLTGIKMRRSQYVVGIFKIMFERFKNNTYYYGQTDTALTPLIYKVKQYIEEHYQEKLSLNLVADYFYISPEHLSREFSRQMGVTFINYLKEKRLFQATHALLFTPFKIEQIAHYHGFSSYHNFNRQFKERFQSTPKQYRLQYQQGKMNKDLDVITSEDKSILISKLQKLMHNRSLVHKYKHLSFKDNALKKISSNYKTYIHLGDVNDFYTPFLGTDLETIEKLSKSPIIVIHCSLKSFFYDDTNKNYKQNLAFCLSMLSNTKIIPSIKLYDFDVQDKVIKDNWHQFIDVIHNYFENKNGELYFDIDHNEFIHLRSQVKETRKRLPDIQIMINAPCPFDHDYEDLNIDMELCQEVDHFAVNYDFNSLYQLDTMNNYDIDNVTTYYTNKLINNLKYLKHHGKNVALMEWNIINGDTKTNSDFYFNAAIILKHLNHVTSYISGLGFWLIEESSKHYASIEKPLSLYLKYNCKSPMNYLLFILTHFNGHEYIEGSNYIKFEQHNKIFILIYNYELYNPHDINYQSNIGVVLSYRDIPFDAFRVTKITFDQDNGNIFKAIRKLDQNHESLDYLNTKLLDKYCSPDIEMIDFKSKNVDETYYVKTNGIKMLIIQKLR